MLSFALDTPVYTENASPAGIKITPMTAVEQGSSNHLLETDNIERTIQL